MGRSRSRSPPPRSARRDYHNEDRRRDRRDDHRPAAEGSRRDDRRDRDRRDYDRGPPRPDHNRGPRDAYDRRPREDYDRRPPPRDDRDRRPPREDVDRRERDRGHDRPPQPRERSRSRSGSADAPKKIEPNFGNSGLLAAATNTVKASDGTSTVLKYNEPPEARKPTQAWRLYVFKGKEDLGLLQVSKQSAYLVGRDHLARWLVADIPIDHPSCSKQHAVFQYRQVNEKDEWGQAKVVVKPFIIDLDSTNGTFVNDVAVPGSRYYELKASDVIKFGQSTREYVLLNEADA